MSGLDGDDAVGRPDVVIDVIGLIDVVLDLFVEVDLDGHARDGLEVGGTFEEFNLELATLGHVREHAMMRHDHRLAHRVDRLEDATLVLAIASLIDRVQHHLCRLPVARRLVLEPGRAAEIFGQDVQDVPVAQLLGHADHALVHLVERKLLQVRAQQRKQPHLGVGKVHVAQVPRVDHSIVGSDDLAVVAVFHDASGDDATDVRVDVRLAFADELVRTSAITLGDVGLSDVDALERLSVLGDHQGLLFLSELVEDQATDVDQVLDALAADLEARGSEELDVPLVLLGACELILIRFRHDFLLLRLLCASVTPCHERPSNVSVFSQNVNGFWQFGTRP